MKKLIFTIAACILLFTGCFDDEGNYNYHDINEIQEIIGIDSVIRIYQFDTLRLTPIFKGTQYSDPERFEYTWEIDQKVVGNHLNLSFPVRIPLGEKFCQFIIRDKELESKYYHVFRLIVSNTRAGDAIMVLSNYKGEAELSFKPIMPDTLAFVPNYYRPLSGYSLGTNPTKMFRNYYPREAHSGLLVFTQEGLKSLADTTMLDLESNTYLDESFIYRQVVYPKPEVRDFTPEGMWQAFINWDYIFGTGPTISMNNSIIAGGNYYSYRLSSNEVNSIDFGAIYKKSPYGGRLSPIMFPVNQVQPANNFLFSFLSYTYSDFLILFDETHGRFLYVQNKGWSGSLLPFEDLQAFPDYRMIYGSHSNQSNYCVVILAKDKQVKALLMKFPGNANEKNGTESQVKISAEVIAEMDMPESIMHSGSNFYTLRNKEYLLVATDSKLFYGNYRNWESGTAPTEVFDLSTLGYDASAKITCMHVSRSERSILLGVSRYGNDTGGYGEELKGDVIVLDISTYEVRKDSRGGDMIYRGVSGYPVDIMIKHQEWYREGKNLNGQMMDAF